jgi:hypothetical protein
MLIYLISYTFTRQKKVDIISFFNRILANCQTFARIFVQIEHLGITIRTFYISYMYGGSLVGMRALVCLNSHTPPLHVIIHRL